MGDTDLVNEFLGGWAVGSGGQWEGRLGWKKRLSGDVPLKYRHCSWPLPLSFFSLRPVCYEMNGPLVHMLLYRESQVIVYRNR